MTTITIRRLGPDDWELLRRLRLEALRDSPAAFESTFEREDTFDEATWRERTTSSAYFLAEEDGEACGMACGYRHPRADGRATMELVSMWVAPDYRRHGVGARLVTEVISYARAAGEPMVGLWVAGDNERAAALYRSLGFEPSGDEQAMRTRPDAYELRMTISLADADE